ncbi:MAG: HD domain-containing phosphohydrolase [Acidobacteriota bacterium]
MDTAPGPKTTRADLRKPPRRIVYAFMLVLVAMGLLPLGFTAWKLIDISRESLVTSQQEAQLQAAASMARHLSTSVDALRAEMVRLADSIESLPRRSGGAPLSAARGRDLLEELLGSDLLLLRYLPRSGPPLEARHDGFDPGPEVEEEIRRGTSAALAGRVRVSDPAFPPRGGGPSAVLVVAVPVGSGRPDGALAGVTDFEALWRPVVAGRRTAYTVYAIDREGRLFAARDEDGVLSAGDYRSFDIVQEFLRSRGRSALTSEFSLDVGSRPVQYIASFDTTSLGWGVFAQLEKRRAYAAVNQMVQTTLIWAGLAMLLALVLAYLLAAHVTRPIQALARGTEAFARGDLDHRVRVRSRNELGELARTFNTMAEQIQSYIQRVRAAAQLNHELFLGTVKSLAEAIDEKDPYTRGHSDRVNRYAVILARQMGLGTREVRAVHIASLFHDIGKIGIEDKILRKPAALTDDEFQVMKRHPEKGAQMLSKIKAMAEIIPGVRFHHEKWDGSGYPLGLKGEQIPLAARIVAVADAFDAMTTNRPYQKAMSYDRAIARLFELSDRVFDRRVVSAFAEAYRTGAVREPKAAAMAGEL